VIALDEVECGELEKTDVADILTRRPSWSNRCPIFSIKRQIALVSLARSCRTNRNRR